MEKISRFCIGVFLVMIIICTSYIGVMLGKMYKAKAEADAKEYRRTIEGFYELETYAFCMDMCKHYCDYSYVNENKLVIRIALYNENNSDGLNITIEEIKDFLSSEYDDNGNLRVINQPQNIKSFVFWNNGSGNAKVRQYIYALRKYSDSYPEKYKGIDIYEMDLDMLNELMNDYENCPNKEDYENQ